MSQLIRGGKCITLFFGRKQRKQLIGLEAQIKRMARVVDDFYNRLGARNWIFHDTLSVDKVEQLLAETVDAASAEERLIDLYHDQEQTKWWTMRFHSIDGLRQRISQIERAREHYDAGQFDSCTMHLIAVMDGFVNDFEPGNRKGLHAREPDDMTAWDSVVGHHMGLTHTMKTFTTTIKKRIDHEVFEVYRNGIMHGAVVNFNNVVVATKAWNMLFAIVDWAAAARKAAEPIEPPPTWGSVFTTLSQNGRYRKYERSFLPSTIEPADPTFNSNNVVVLASDFLDAWQHKRWGLVAGFTPPRLRGVGSVGEAARDAKDVFEQYNLESWSIESITYDQASTVLVQAMATVDTQKTKMRFRMMYTSEDGGVGIPEHDVGEWSLASGAPRTFFQKTI